MVIYKSAVRRRNEEIMKKLAVVFLTAGMVILAGCGNEEKVIEGNVQNVVTGTDESDTDLQEGQEEEPAAGSAKGYVFTVGDTVVEIDAKADPIVEMLGEPGSVYEVPSCAFEGVDRKYSYSGFELDTYPLDGEDHVSAVVFKDDSVATTEGVCIGDSREKLTEVYGEGSEEGGMVVYEKDGMKLMFILQGDDIASIEYRSTILDE